MKKASVAIVGSGNIGADLMYKLLRSEAVEPKWMIGIDAASEGLRLARAEGLIASHEGAEWLLAQHERPDIVIEATSASAHAQNAPKYAAAGIRAIDLTPAAVGPAVVPAVNLLEHAAAENVSLITCGGQATIPIVAAISAHVPVGYAEIVSSAASPSVGPGTRANIDEFTRTTARGLEAIGRAVRGKAIIILNPAEPPVMMSNTVFAQIPDDSDRALLTAAIEARVREIADYVPGYALKTPPQFAAADPNTGAPASVAVFLQVTGAADYLPAYAGNLDIMTSAATRVAETFAATIAQERARNGF